MDYLKESLKYHSKPFPGKTSVKITKPCSTQKELSLAYTPGVASSSLEIAKDKVNSFKYTNRGNLVGVISNGTAVLGLGNIGADASKPVMEGKAVLFKKFADVDAFDIEVNEKDPDKFIEIVASLEPTFGGINLEDIKGPECFYIEQELKKRMDIPVFHDDQHGTAIIATAGLVNAAELTGKDISKMKIIVSGAGAAAIPTANMFIMAGADAKNIFMFDKEGFLNKKRKDINAYNKKFCSRNYESTMEKEIEGADLFLGLSAKGVLTEKMFKSMAKDPILFALANPHPEIEYAEARKARKDAIISTGRSDYPNQINNVLGFPFIFRGVLDCGSKKITDTMKMAASLTLSKLARKNVPDYVKKLYGADLKFSRDYIIPKPFDRRVFIEESSAVLEQAVKEGHNRFDVDIEKYRKSLKKRFDI